MTAVAIVIVLLFSYAYVGNDDGDDSLSGEVYIIHTNDTHGFFEGCTHQQCADDGMGL